MKLELPHTVNVNIVLSDPAISAKLDLVITALTSVANAIPQLRSEIMSELTDLKASVAELKKDSARSLEALGETRQSLTDVKAALETLKTSTNLSAEDRAAVDEIKTMVADTDAMIEEKVPEAPAPEPVPAPEPTPEPAPGQ